MVDLDELKRLAEGATPTWRAVDRTYALDDHKSSYFAGVVDSDGDNVCLAGFSLSGGKQAEANGRYCAAMSPDTAKKLIAVALAAQRVVAEGADQWGAIPKLRTAMEELK